MSCPHGSLPWDGVTGCSICARLATPVPASNVSEGLREAVERYIVAMTRRASGGTTDAEVQAAYAALYDAAAPERLEPTWCVAHKAYDHCEDAILARLSQPASNVSEGLREAAQRLVAALDDAQIAWSAVPEADEAHEALRAALAHAAPDGLDALVDAAHAVYLRLATGGTPTWDEYNALNAALHPFVLSQPDATEETGLTVEQRNARGALAADDFEGDR